MKTHPTNTIPDQHLFTVRGRPVMFRKTETYFGALHATERGDFPISCTGYYSLAGFSHHARQGGKFHDLLSANFLESIAAEQQRRANAVLRDIAQCITRRDITDSFAFIHCLHRATEAFQHGLFATDTQRRQLWQVAHETYSNMFVSRFVQHVPKEQQNLPRIIESDRQTFDILCRCMRGDFSFDRTAVQRVILGMRAYCELPPKPEGEPVITTPTHTLELDFGDCPPPFGD